MNITIITSTFPYPLKSGGAQAQYNFIDSLRHQHHISIICPENGKNTRAACSALSLLWPDVKLHLYSYPAQLTHFPFLWDKMVRATKLKIKADNERFRVERALKPYGYNLSKRFLAFVNKHIREHQTDLIEVDFYPYLSIVNYLPKDIKHVFVQHEIRYVRNQRLLAPLQLTTTEQQYFEFLKQQELENLNKYDHVITLTDTDKRIMQEDGVTTPISVSPAAVNSPLLPFEGWNGKLTFIGGYNHIPNQEGIEWFLEKVLPLLQQDSIKGIEVVGSGWPQHYNSIHPKVHFTGFADNLAKAVHGSLLIVPILTGSGMRMKILDAAAMGVPFVTTSVGVEGLMFKDGESCVIADTPNTFAQAINMLVANTEKMGTLAANAQQIFKQHYSIEVLAKVRNAIYQSIKNS
jgi:glycosyltransferase involved in cell wall biosynthesis